MEEFRYEKLGVWQKAMDLVDYVYTASSKLPKEEMYGLASQMRRAAVSIPSNISEGYGLAPKQFAHHLRIARGSVYELRTQIDVSRRQHFFTDNEAATLKTNAVEVAKMLDGLLSSLEK